MQNPDFTSTKEFEDRLITSMKKHRAELDRLERRDKRKAKALSLLRKR